MKKDIKTLLNNYFNIRKKFINFIDIDELDEIFIEKYDLLIDGYSTEIKFETEIIKEEENEKEKH